VRLINLLFVAAILLIASSATAEDARRWTARAGWEFTSLGAPRPTGFGVTGGHTVRLGVERVVVRIEPWSFSTAIDVRSYGFADEGPRTMGAEVDAGVRIERAVKLPWFDEPFRVGGLVSYGGFRAPLATAVGVVRFNGLRPAIELAVGYVQRSGARIAVGGGCRFYATLVWSDYVCAAHATGGWTW
jgi:hypothetical protein